jgi:tetratricopeptide (TPR) repeat protein
LTLPAAAIDEQLDLDRRAGKVKELGGQAAPPLQMDELTLEEGTGPVQIRGEPAPEDDPRGRELRKKMMARGLRNLGAMPSRQEPEAAEAEPVIERSAASADAQMLGGEEAQLAEEVRSRAKVMPQQNAYARLNVSPQAPQDAIKQAYLQLAKRYHPDRASPNLQHLLHDELQSVFTGLKEAWDSLSTPELRAKYDQSLKASGKGASRKEEAALTLKMGETLLKKRDFEGAINKLRRAVDLDPSGDSMAALAWGLVCDPKASAATKEEAATLINRALRAPGATARTYYVAGVLWRTKDPESAVDAFRKALEMDPHHSDAALELRLIEQRRGKAQKKEGGGVLSGLLFGKRKS